MPRHYKNKNTDRETFTEKFGKPIEQYITITKATETLGKTTINSYLRKLPKYFLFLNQNPDEVIAQRKQDLNGADDEKTEYYERKTAMYARVLVDSGRYTGQSATSQVALVQGFFRNISKRYALDMRRLKLPKGRKTKKYSPSNEEIRHIYGCADSARDRLIIALMYHTGADPIDLCALNINCLPIEPYSYFEYHRAKTGEIWRGVITPDISRDLQVYLEQRKFDVSSRDFEGKKEDLKKLFIGHKGAMLSQGISNIIRELIDNADLGDIEGLKPTSLRDSFEDALVFANVNSKIKETLMGHVGGIEHEYGGQKQIEIACVEAVKKAYPLMSLSDAQAHVDNSGLQERVEQLEFEVKKLLLRLDGMDAGYKNVIKQQLGVAKNSDGA